MLTYAGWTMKKILGAIFIFSFACMCIFSSPLSVEGGIALHDSSLFDMLAEGSVRLSYGDFEIGANTGSGKYMNIAARYTYNVSDYFFLKTDIHWAHTFSSGGFLTVSEEADLDMKLLGPFYLDFGLGIQAGTSYSLYANGFYPFSLSPYVVIRAGARSRYFSIEAYTSGSTFFEKTFQAVPIAGLDIAIGINSSNWIKIETFFKLADYMAGPPLQITDLAARISYCYRTDL